MSDTGSPEPLVYILGHRYGNTLVPMFFSILGHRYGNTLVPMFFSILGHRYGNTLVPMSADDKENMKYKAVKCFKILGFTNEDKVSEIIFNF